ncbi:MAG: hypothetical protein LUQ31_08130 [Methanoregula sp.]|nr:hypothetical protein [Methanoregula sp.]
MTVARKIRYDPYDPVLLLGSGVQSPGSCGSAPVVVTFMPGGYLVMSRDGAPCLYVRKQSPDPDAYL